jgi:predicted 3-demethylubiquinone-9 3-methyltransferase (glyoxalase superfamily)
MQKIVPCLWFDGTAEEAARLYTSLVPDARVTAITRYGKGGADTHGQPEGKVMTVDLEVGGYRISLLDGGPHFRLTPAISLFVALERESDVDVVWEALSEGGSVLMPLDRHPWSQKYGWLSDRFGVSWQISLGKRSDIGGQAMAPSLLFVGSQHGKTEAALQHYTSVFAESSVEGILRHDGTGPEPAGTVMHAQFQLRGETFMAMDSAGEHDFGFTEAFSLIVQCETQDEIDHHWNALSAVPEAAQCGWVKDRFGVSWQIVPRILFEMMLDADPQKVERVTNAFMQMKKLEIEPLKRAYAG